MLFDLLLAEWHLPAPNLVVSLVGEERPFAMKSWLRDVLRKGLVKAAQSTGATLPGPGSRPPVAPRAWSTPACWLPWPSLRGSPYGLSPSTQPAVGAAPGNTAEGLRVPPAQKPPRRVPAHPVGRDLAPPLVGPTGLSEMPRWRSLLLHPAAQGWAPIPPPSPRGSHLAFQPLGSESNHWALFSGRLGLQKTLYKVWAFWTPSPRKWL